MIIVDEVSDMKRGRLFAALPCFYCLWVFYLPFILWVISMLFLFSVKLTYLLRSLLKIFSIELHLCHFSIRWHIGLQTFHRHPELIFVSKDILWYFNTLHRCTDSVEVGRMEKRISQSSSNSSIVWGNHLLPPHNNRTNRVDWILAFGLQLV